MRTLTDVARQAVQTVINANGDALAATRGFISAEPGFAIVDGAIVREPAVIVKVAHKMPPDHLLAGERAPRQLGAYRVCVVQADPYEQLEHSDEFTPLTVAFGTAAESLTYEPIEGDPIDEPFTLERPLLCHVGPDAGWPVLRPFLEGTESRLSVAMYDLNAEYIAKALIDIVSAADINVTLTWDDGMTPAETDIRTRLRTALAGKLDGWIVKCGGGRRFASAYHEKVAVRDSKAFWLSSGNWSLRSQPNIDPIAVPATAKGMYSKGNREWHVIVDDEPLAKLFEQYIRHDRDGSEEESQQGAPDLVLSEEEPLSMPDLFVPIAELAAPMALDTVEPVPPATLPSQQRKVKVRPLLTPDNYVGRITELLKGAKRSIYLQFAYVTYTDKTIDKDFTALLKVLADFSFKPNFDLRIIVGNSDATNKVRKLAEAGFNEKVFRVQASVHNKGIIVDDETVLVSSANWSGDGVLRNRDAGLLIYDAEIAGYYRDVFLYDWESRATPTLGDDPVAVVATADAPTPPGMVRMRWQDYYG